MPIERRVSQIPVAVERRKAGRPRLVDGEDTVTVNIRMPASQFDRVCAEALREDVSVSQVIRRKLDLLLVS